MYLQIPPTASYKMITEKCNEFGQVQRIEDKGNSGVLVVFTSEWEAERAISILLILQATIIFPQIVQNLFQIRLAECSFLSFFCSFS